MEGRWRGWIGCEGQRREGGEGCIYLYIYLLYFRSLRHPSIVQFIGLYAADGNHYMVTEFVEGGSLEYLLHWQPGFYPFPFQLFFCYSCYSCYERQLLSKYVGFFTYRDVIRLARDASAGMCLLEQRGIIHRDLAARNLLVHIILSSLDHHFITILSSFYHHSITILSLCYYRFTIVY